MTDILYTYKNQVYANITNRCDCSCTFCVRSTKDTVGDATNMWFDKEPDFEEIKKAIDAFDFSSYDEFVFCGYGEPTCALENLLKTAQYVKETLGLKIRLNTNGLCNLYHNRNIIPELANVIDSISISLNAPTAEKYQAVTRPQFENAFPALLEFASLAKKSIPHTQLSIVDVLPSDEIEACQKLADEHGIYLKIRKFAKQKRAPLGAPSQKIAFFKQKKTIFTQLRQIEISRTQLCVLFSIAVLSYLILFGFKEIISFRGRFLLLHPSAVLLLT